MFLTILTYVLTNFLNKESYEDLYTLLYVSIKIDSLIHSFHIFVIY